MKQKHQIQLALILAFAAYTHHSYSNTLSLYSKNENKLAHITNPSFKRSWKTSGGFLGLNIHYANVAAEYQPLYGGRIGLTYDDIFVFAAYIQSNLNQSTSQLKHLEGTKYSFWHTGLQVGIYEVHNQTGLRGALMFSVGIGKMETSDFVKDDFIIASPGFELDYEIAEHIYLCIGTNYTITDHIHTSGYANKQFQGLSGYLSVKVGHFKH